MEQTKSSNCPHRKTSETQNKNLKKKLFLRFLFPLMGLASLIWMLIRIIPKPSRAEYPCMKVAAPMASGFVVYILGLVAAVFSFKKARRYFRNSRYIFASVFLLVCVTAIVITLLNPNSDSYANSISIKSNSVFAPIDSPNTPMGTAKGIFPGRVVWKWDPLATSWSGTSGNWWSDANTNQIVVDTMLSQSLRALTGKSTDAAAWDTLIRYFNVQHGKGSKGYQTGEKFAIKINLNQTYSNNYKDPKNASFTSPQTVLALLRQLVNNAGVPDSNITFYDLIRVVPDPIYTKCKNEFPNVHFMGWEAVAGREKYVRDTNDYIHYSYDLSKQVNHVEPTYMATVVSQAAYMINLASFKAHNYGGVTFGAKNHFGSISSDDSNHVPYIYAPHAAGVHRFMTVHYFKEGDTIYTYAERPMGSYNPLVDMMGFKDLGGKTLLFMIDALYGVQSERVSVTASSKWKSAPFSNDWTSSLFLSQDDVALESVGLDFFRAEQAVNTNYTLTYGSVDNYLHEASQANNPPSGTFYHPNGDTVRLQSLGVHEHWNNATDKQYTRNLKTGNGIELFPPQSGSTSVNEVIIPSGFVLNQNYPNPFNPTTKITYTLPIRSSVSINIFDALGRNVAALVNEEKPAGKHEIQFNAKNLSSGIYFYRIQVRQISGGPSAVLTETKKLVLLK